MVRGNRRRYGPVGGYLIDDKTVIDVVVNLLEIILTILKVVLKQPGNCLAYLSRLIGRSV